MENQIAVVYCVDLLMLFKYSESILDSIKIGTALWAGCMSEHHFRSLLLHSRTCHLHHFALDDFPITWDCDIFPVIWTCGTDDDLPVQKVNRFSRGTVRMNECMRVPAASMPRGGASPNMEEQIHNLEMEAYNAVLKAFIAQADDLSWGKEKLISQLRHELKVSEIEHIESLATVDSDDLVRHIRDWRKGNKGSHELLPNTTYASGVVPGPSLVNAHKKLKMTHFTASPNCFPRVQSSSMLPSASPNYMPHLQLSAGLKSSHLRDNQWSEGAFVNEGNVGQSVKSLGHIRDVPITSKGRGSLKVHPGKNYAPLTGDAMKKVGDRIEIRETHVIIHEVERVCGVENPNPALLEKAKLILKEHEKSLLEAIAKLERMADLGA